MNPHAFHPAPPLSIKDLVLSFGLIALTVMLFRYEKIALQKALLIGTLRTILQLFVVGFIIQAIFQNTHWFWVLLMVVVMIVVAGHTAYQRLARFKQISHLLLLSNVALAMGAGFTIWWVNAVTLHIHPWYQPQFLIPLAGMIIGNSMTGLALALERLFSELTARRGEIEALLSLGATPAQAAKKPYLQAVEAAMIPNINAMMVVGIVSLPGMMTGQILAGQSPLAAVHYQIVVMFMITCASALTVVIAAKWALKQCFNSAEQLML
jgi:putative ABC transport system permease protein